MNRFLLPLGAFGLLVIVLAIGIKHSPTKDIIVSPLIGRTAPAFTVPALNDVSQQVSSRNLRGQWYLFNVWGTWCVACRAEHAMLLEVKRAGVVPIIGLDWKDEDQSALEWLSQLGNPYAVVGTDHEGRTAIDWGVYAAPESFLVNPDGVVVYKQIGPLTREAWEHEILARLPPRPAQKS